MTDVIGFSSPKSQWQSHRDDIQHAIHDVLMSGQYIQGKYHRKFETEFANYLGVPHVVAVGSGTDALVIAIRGLGLQAGDEILVPTLTAPATISAVRQTGAVPRFIDVDQTTFTIKIEDIKNEINERTRAIIVVHLYGFACDVRKIRELCDERGLFLIEDCAQSAGAKFDDLRVGSIGHVGCFSFFPTKNLGAIGDGGALSTHDAGLAEQFRRIRTYGWSEERICIQDGINSRLDEMQAAILCVKLPYLDKENRRRSALAKRYSEGLKGYQSHFHIAIIMKIFPMCFICSSLPQKTGTNCSHTSLTGVYYVAYIIRCPVICTPACQVNIRGLCPFPRR